jgi:hypothetical protein
MRVNIGEVNGGTIIISGKVEGLEIGGFCELAYPGCTGLGELREDPYEADVNENPGEMMIACNECTQERSDGI